MTHLQLSRLRLTRCTPSDAADFIALEADPEVMRYLNGGRIGLAGDGTFLQPRGTEPQVWTARLGDGRFVGWFCLWPEDDAAELGYRLARPYWGQGLATEGAAGLLAWGFDVAGHSRITASTLAVNLASRRVMEKIGMTYLRTDFPDWPTRFAGTEQGEVWYQALPRN